MLPLVVGVVVAGLGEAEEAAAGLVGAGVAAAGLGEVVAGLWRAKGDKGGGGWPLWGRGRSGRRRLASAGPEEAAACSILMNLSLSRSAPSSSYRRPLPML